jgi:hypothetical protein
MWSPLLPGLLPPFGGRAVNKVEMVRRAVVEGRAAGRKEVKGEAEV